MHKFRQWYFLFCILVLIFFYLDDRERKLRLPQLPQQKGNIMDSVGKYSHGNWSPPTTPDILLLTRRCCKLSFTYKEHDVFHKRCIRLLFIELFVYLIYPHDQRATLSEVLLYPEAEFSKLDHISTPWCSLLFLTIISKLSTLNNL